MSEILKSVAENTGVEEETVVALVDELMLQMHRHFVEYDGDVIGEDLWVQMRPQAFYHFLGLLDDFRRKYEWEPGTANEYILRLGQRTDWLPYKHQIEGWKWPS